MLQLYADEQFPLPVVQRLRALGYDILTAQDGWPSESTCSYGIMEEYLLKRIDSQHQRRLSLGQHLL